MNQTQQLRYFLYARKSSESEDRQMASIEDQIKEVKKIASELGLEIVAVYSESKSAKAPGRKVFNEMLLQIEKGKADGILCWKLNRLARNPVDGGKISWMLQQNIIQHIQCYGRDYKPSDNVLMMQVELGMANQFVKDLSVDVRRGARAKAERGWNPSARLPIGYIHNKDTKRKVHSKEIAIDKKRYHIVRELWELMLTGDYSLADIKREGDRLGLVSENKRLYATNTYHKMFSNEFYYGYFYWKNDKGFLIRHKGKHQKMITEEEFEKVQYSIGIYKKATRPKKYNYPYKGLLKCGECNSSITAERKYQVRCTGCRFKFSCMHREDCPKCKTKIKDMENPTVIDIIYYRCSKRKQKCSQKFITQIALEQQFLTVLKGIEVPQDFYDLMTKELESLNLDSDNKERQVIVVHKKRISELNNRLKSLTLMRADAEIDRNDFNEMKKETNETIKTLEKEIENSNYREIYWLEIAKDYLNVALNASKIIKNKDTFIKKGLLSKLGSNQLLLDQKVHFIRVKPLLAIKKCFDYYTAEKERFELKNHHKKQGDLQGFYTQNSSWCTELNNVRTSSIELNTIKTNTDLLVA
jgi:site-specific DNA recombinase